MSTVGLFGKIPAQGDFVRVNTSDPAAQSFDPWCQEALAAIQRINVPLAADPIYFVYRAQATRNVLVGAMAPSEDRVGRQFPLTIFTVVDAPSIAPRFSGLPVAYSSFLEAASLLLEQSKTLELADLSARLSSLPLPDATEHARADEICRRTLDNMNGRELQERIFGDLARGQQYYAFNTMVLACAQCRGVEPPRANIVIDCPVTVDVDLFVWLDLARRLLRWRSAPPAFVWTENETPRLLISLGPPPPPILSFVAKPGSDSQKLWPLLTQRPDAIQAAKTSMQSRQRTAIDDPRAVLENLLVALSG